MITIISSVCFTNASHWMERSVDMTSLLKMHSIILHIKKKVSCN